MPEQIPSSYRRIADWTIEPISREASAIRRRIADRKLSARLRFAKLRHHAVPEDVGYRSERGLERALFLKLIGGDWIDARDNRAICGQSGVGKSWLAWALGHKACRDNRSVLYQRVPRLFANLALAHGDGRYARLQRTLGYVQLLILDDWGLEPLNEQARHDLLEILEDRYGRRSTIITSQLPVAAWHQVTAIPPTPMPSLTASFQRSSHCPFRRKLAAKSAPEILTRYTIELKTITASRTPASRGRDHPGIRGRNHRDEGATSSESARKEMSTNLGVIQFLAPFRCRLEGGPCVYSRG